MTGIVWLALAGVLMALDQLAKYWALQSLAPVGSIPAIGFLQFTYVENRGAAFGILQGKTTLLAVVTLAILVGAVWLLFSGRLTRTMEKVTVTLILAGGAGNLYDRLARGFVVDFIDINRLFSYPMFNLADCYVVIGACLLAATVFFSEVKAKKASPPAGGPTETDPKDG